MILTHKMTGMSNPARRHTQIQMERVLRDKVDTASIVQQYDEILDQYGKTLILNKFPEIDEYKTKLQMGHTLNSRATNDVYLFNQLSSPGFENSFEKHVLLFLTVSSAGGVQKDVTEFFPDKNPPVPENLPTKYESRRKKGGAT